MEQVELKAPKGVASVSFGGEEFAVNKGLVTVPAAAVPDLVAQGFFAPDQPE